MSAVSSVSNSTTTPNPATIASLNTALGATGGNTSLGQQDFLNLLTTQLQNQDPLQPMSDTDFVAQMANFSSLQEMQTLNGNFTTYSGSSLVDAAQTFIGKQVTVTDPTLGAVTGTVTGIDVQSGVPDIVVNGTDYDTSTITNVSALPSTGN